MSQSGENLRRIKRHAVNKGYWRFDDMFAWVERLLVKYPEVMELIGWRFPAVFMDETQDTSEIQERLLNTIFPASGTNLRQRFGDSNQTIYDLGHKGVTTDLFPSPDYRSLSNSQRFGSSIATKGAPLAVKPINPSLSGEGPCNNALSHALNLAVMPHTIFLFTADTIKQVLPTFGSLILQTFPDEVLRSEAFLARAIGRV